MSNSNLRPWIRTLLPLLVLGLSVWGVKYIMTHKPEPQRGRPAASNTLTVDAIRLQQGSFQVVLDSYGVVRPRTESELIPQVSGQVVAVSERLREGAFFSAGEELLRIDDRDYRAELAIAKAQLVEAELRLSEEQARAAQAQRDWQRLGQGDAGDLVLRRPQVAAAEAAIASANARVTTAELNLERTRIRAPYPGRVLSKSVDLGQVVTPGKVLANLYAVDYVEVRLPLKSRQLQYIDLPEQYRDGQLSSTHQPPVTIEARYGNQRYRWLGRVVRVEGAIDQTTRQLYVVAQVDDPYGRGAAGNPPLKIGQFVEARIEGKSLNDVFVLPRAAVRQDNRVLIVMDGRLQGRQVRPIWFDEQYVVVDQGLAAGEVVSLTPLGSGAEGARVTALIEGEPSQRAKADEGADNIAPPTVPAG